MTGRTLEEIEALAADATPGPWWINPEFRADVHCQHGCIAEVIDFDAVHPDSFASEQQRLANAELIAALPDLLAIAQGQREELERLHKYIGYLHDSIPELTDEMIDNACGPAMQPIQGIEAVAYGMRMARRSGYRDGWSNCVYRFKQVKEIESPLIGTKK